MNQMQAQMLNMMQSKSGLMKRAEQMLEGKSDEEKAQVIANVCNQCGINLEQAFKQFQNNVGLFQQFFGGINR